jgi:hypothetical protein
LSVSPASQALDDGATVTWALGSGRVATLTIGGNRTLETSGTPVVGQWYILRITLSGAGRTLAHSATYFELPGGVAVPLASGDGDITTLTYLGTAGAKLALMGASYDLA